MTLNEQLIDKRVVQRNLDKGRLDAVAYRQALEALPDLSGKVWRTDHGTIAQAATSPRVAEPKPEPVSVPAPVAVAAVVMDIAPTSVG